MSAIHGAAQADAKTILVVGDSISAAYGLKLEQGWVSLLQLRLHAQGYGYRVVNASVSGETTSGGLSRLPRALALQKPSIVILELGGNDGLRGLPLATTRSNLNDMVVDSSGRAYAGNFGFDLMAFAEPSPANLIRIDPDGTASVAAEELLFPNGSVITPDGSTLIVGETAGARYTAFTIAEDGSLTDRRVWAQVAPEPDIGGSLEATLAQLQFGPDGCTLDAEGMIWAADEVNGRLARVAEGGEIVDEIPSPEGLNFFACALGGEDGCTMLICAAPDFLEANRVNARDAVLVTTRVDVPHAGLP